MRISSMTPITRNSLLGYREVWFRYWYIMITQNNNSCNNLTFSTTGAQKSCLIVYWKDHLLIFLQGSEEANGGTDLDAIRSSATTTGMMISSGWMAHSSFMCMDWHIVLKNLDLDLLVPLNDYTWPLDLCIQRPWYLLFVESLPFWQRFACHKQWLYGKVSVLPFPTCYPTSTCTQTWVCITEGPWGDCAVMADDKCKISLSNQLCCLLYRWMRLYRIKC